MGGVFYKVHTHADDALKLHLVGDEMVGGCHHDRGFGGAREDAVVGVGDAGCGVAAHGLAQHLIGLQFGQVLKHQSLVGGVGHHQEVLGGDDGQEPLEGGADKVLACPQDVEELLGVVILA